MALTAKQELFITGLLQGLSQREAYKQAYNCKNMTDTVIDVKACELLKNGKVSVRYNELNGRVIKELEDEGVINAKKVLNEIADIAFDDISNYLDFYTDASGNVRTTIKDSKTINTKNIAEVSCGKDGIFKFKLYCKDNALQMLGKHLKLFTDKTELTGKDGGPIETVDKTDPEAIEARINELIAKRNT